jgi:hypothetical protein
MLYACGRCRQWRNISVKYLANSFAGAFFQLIIGMIGVFCLCSFIVAWEYGAVCSMFLYFHLLFWYNIVTLF